MCTYKQIQMAMAKLRKNNPNAFQIKVELFDDGSGQFFIENQFSDSTISWRDETELEAILAGEKITSDQIAYAQ